MGAQDKKEDLQTGNRPAIIEKQTPTRPSDHASRPSFPPMHTLSHRCICRMCNIWRRRARGGESRPISINSQGLVCRQAGHSLRLASSTFQCCEEIREILVGWDMFQTRSMAVARSHVLNPSIRQHEYGHAARGILFRPSSVTEHGFYTL